MLFSNLSKQDDKETQFVYVQLLNLLRSQNITILIASLLVISALVAIGFNAVNILYLAVWLLCFVVALMAHYFIRKRMPTTDSALHLQALLALNVKLTVVKSVLFAVSCLAFSEMSDAHRMLFTLILLSTVIANLSNCAGNAIFFWAHAGPIVLGLSACWAVFAGEGYSGLSGKVTGLLILAPFSPMIWAFAKFTWKLFDDSCRLRFRERELNAQLSNALLNEEQANLGKTRFIASASHDLRQPLHVIGFIGSALKLRSLDAESKNMVDLLNQASGNLQTLLSSLLDISKLDSSLIVPNVAAISLRRQVQQFNAEFLSLSKEKNLSSQLLFTNIAIDDDLIASLDPALFLRILSNVAHNALKFTQSGFVNFIFSEQENDIVLEIRDSGCGIAEEHIAHLFFEFYQVENSERSADKGLGLGLSIVKRLSDLLGIKISIESELGRGSTVRLIIPRDNRVASDVPDVTHGKNLALGSNAYLARGQKSIVLVDDDRAVLQATYLLLTQLGCKCACAQDLLEAQSLIRNMAAPPDMIISDLRLRDGASGIDGVNALRKEFGQNLPAFLVSGDTDPARLLQAKAANIALLHKPLSLEKLGDLIAGRVIV